MFMTKHETLLPIAQTLVDNLVMLAKAFADATKVKITTVGTNSTKTASFYVDLESGKTSCTLRKYDLLTAWFSENWPEGHVMPMLKDPTHYSVSVPEGKSDVKKAIPRQAKGRAKGGKKEGRGSVSPKARRRS